MSHCHAVILSHSHCTMLLCCIVLCYVGLNVLNFIAQMNFIVNPFLSVHPFDQMKECQKDYVLTLTLKRYFLK